MRLTDYLDKGASIDPAAPCLTMTGRSRSYREVQRLSWLIGRALARSGVKPGDKVAVLAGNDPVAFSCVFGIARAGAVWCPVNPGNEAAETRELLDLLDCSCLIFQRAYAPLVERIAGDLPKLTTIVCLDGDVPVATSFRQWLEGLDSAPFQAAQSGSGQAGSGQAGSGQAGRGQAGSGQAPNGPAGDRPASDGPTGSGTPDDVVMIVGTGGTTGSPKGVQLTGRNIETMTALTLISYPFDGRPVYLTLTPLTLAAGVMCFPVMSLGGEIVVMPTPDLSEFLALIAEHKVTHAFLPPTLIYKLLDHSGLESADLSSLQCLWYGAAPISSARLAEAVRRIGPVLGQLFGQTEAPMMISTMAPGEHVRPDGSLALERYASAGSSRLRLPLSRSWTSMARCCRAAIVARSSCAGCSSWRVTTGTRQLPLRCRASAGTTPATSATSTRTTTCTSWTVPRTRLLLAGSTCTRPRSSRPCSSIRRCSTARSSACPTLSGVSESLP